ncbi:MAG: conserved repeat domain protein [Gemmatimonadetes bacterium]|nr:conserved repeat domain protein [Gemmatimonadota bacterium]
MKLHSRIVLALAALMTAAAPAVAQRAPQGNPLTITATNTTAAAGAARGTRRADDRVRGGDVIRYRLAFTNPGAAPVRHVVMADPVPAGLRFVAGSTTASRPDALVEYSVDGGKTFSAHPMETVVVDGRPVTRPAAAERYTHVRWTVEGAVAPHATVTAEFDARYEAASGTSGAAAAPAAGKSGL